MDLLEELVHVAVVGRLLEDPLDRDIELVPAPSEDLQER